MKLLLLAIAILFATPAVAQMAMVEVVTCAPLTKMNDTLKQYGETRRGLGLTGPAIVELRVSKKTGTWSVVRTTPNGVSCFLTGGKDWVDVDPAKEGDPT